jgi:adenine-specific DNA-methyltransferase
MAKKTTKKKTGPKKKLVTITHDQKRTNIPTEELRDFVSDDVQKQTKVLYPRNPDLDPQLVWRGKDEQDACDLEVPSVPIYIQEKIHPQAIIEDFKRTAAKPDDNDPQLDLFSDFNGLPEDFDQRVDFYQHEGNWSNRLILGDSLLVMTSLAEKERLKGKVQMIYIDPPYGIKFGSNWQVSTRKRDVKDGQANHVTRQPEQVKAFRDTWKLGVHSYLAYMRDRLAVSRDLLTDSGSVFIQIGDENVHLVRCLLDEVFGANNFHAQINFKSTSALGQKGLAQAYDYILWYAKDISAMKFRPLFRYRGIQDDREWRLLDDSSAQGGYRRLTDTEFRSLDDYNSLFRRAKLTSSGFTKTCIYEFAHEGAICRPFGGKSWLTTKVGMHRLSNADRLFLRGASPYGKQYYRDFPVVKYDNCWSDQPAAESRVYVVQTAQKFIERCMHMTTDPGDLVLDPTCGSGTVAFAAEQWGRRWITIDSSRVALTLARTRLMAGRFPYYLLSDSPEGLQKEADVTDCLPPTPLPKTQQDVRKGFVNERVPHVTVKSIANNEEIDSIHAEWQKKLEPIRSKLNKAAKQKCEEWQVPRTPSEDLDEKQTTEAWDAIGIKEGSSGAKLLVEWRELRRKRQKEIDESIARRADTEILYDKPYTDNKRVRVTGPFTVESLSPHRTISAAAKKEQAEAGSGGRTLKTYGPDKFGALVLENLRTAGVQNTFKNERLKFDSLQPYAGQWIHGEGHFAESDGTNKRAAICIGPEHGTVGALLIKEAAKEAVQGVGFDMLIVCGFAFDAAVGDEAKRYGKLVVLPTKMNPDLAMGELLKKTGSGNLFMVFGEPDVDVATGKDGKVTVEISGLDVYDPTTGEVRSSSTDDIACWFIDTNYNGESFFVRHAYFTGADEPYDKLKRALRAEIDEAAWSELYSTKSRPFAKPETGKIAIKVINHYGDEVMKVYEV